MRAKRTLNDIKGAASRAELHRQLPIESDLLATLTKTPQHTQNVDRKLNLRKRV
jgi:hypothetical protein